MQQPPFLDISTSPNANFLYGFPTTRYQGSKRKLLPWLFKHFKELDFSSALDVFGGSGMVSYLFKRMGKQVVFNDCMHFNFFVGQALIENSSVTLHDTDIKALLQHSQNNNHQPFISKHFGGIYFKANENRWLDSTLSHILELNHYKHNVLKYKKALEYCALFQSCLVKRPFNLFHRKNLDIRTRRVTRSFGNKTTWETSFEDHFCHFAEEINTFVFSNGKKNIACTYSASEIPEIKCDLVYIDPPYLSDSRHELSDYHRHYHFLEGMARRDEWENLIDFKTINHRFKQMPNPWMDKRKVLEEFRKLFDKFRHSVIVVSYKHPGIPSAEEIKGALQDIKKSCRVKMVTRKYTYALNKSNGNPKKNLELLFIAE